jgi:hypothetical protein
LLWGNEENTNMATDSCLCPGIFSVFVATTNPADNTDVTAWTFLEHVDSWELDPNRQEAPRKQTSSTCRQAIKFCADQLQWQVTVTNTLCGDDWLYCHILDDPRYPSVGATTWFFLGFDPGYLKAGCGGQGWLPSVTDMSTLIDGGYTTNEAGIYLYGQVSPPGFGATNEGQDVSTAEWLIDVTNGPYLPYSKSDVIGDNSGTCVAVGGTDGVTPAPLVAAGLKAAPKPSDN